VTPTVVATAFTDTYPMSEPRVTGGPPTVTVRMDSELVRLARIVCAGRTMKLVDYLDAMVREKIVADYEAFMAEKQGETAKERPTQKRKRKGGESSSSTPEAD
jgi:hypothetical protein